MNRIPSSSSKVFACVSFCLLIACSRSPERHEGNQSLRADANTEGSGLENENPSTSDLTGDKTHPARTDSMMSAGNPGDGTAKCSLGTFGIVGGQLAEADDEVEKSTVRVVMEGARRRGGNCTGTIIGPRHIVTATHCIDENAPTRVMFGRQRQTPDAVIEVEKYVLHPRYSERLRPGERMYDTSVLLLKEDIPAKYKVVAVADSKDLRVGQPVVLAGFGRYSEDDKVGDRSLTWIASELEHIRADSAILETTFGNKRGTCYGDSGGPMYLLDTQTRCLTLAGSITSASTSGDGSCDQGGDMMMDVTRYQGWMKCAFEKMGAPLPVLKDDSSAADCVKTVVRTP